MNKIISLLLLVQIVSTFGRNCHPNETCVALLECGELMWSSQEVRAMNRCNLPRKYCCPSISKQMTVDLSMPKFPKDCGSTPKYENFRVVGGRVIEPDEFSWLASLEYKHMTAQVGVCGGAVINARYVLTAAHCVTGAAVELLGGLTSVRLGDFSNGQKCDYGTRSCQHFQRFDIEEIIVHQNYTSSTFQILNDISLLRLNRTIQFTDMLKPVCLPFGSNDHIAEPTSRTWIAVTGWGRTSSREDEIAKRAVWVPLWKKDRCFSDIRRKESQFCAGMAGRGSCHGDSGGPVMYEFANKRMVLEGVVSYGGAECATESFPFVSTRVRSFANWIETNIHL